MKRNDWNDLGAVSPPHLADAVLQLHWAAQLVAAAGQTFAEPAADDRHRAMTWDTEHRWFVGAPFAGPYPFRAALRPDDLNFMLLDRADDALGTLPLAGASLEEAYEWVSLGMATYMGTTPPRIERPEYDLPEHPLQHGARFSDGDSAALHAFSALYASAAEVLEDVVSHRDDASPVRCWPHYFDLATLLTLERAEDGTASRTIGVGLAPSGGGYDSWYWYVSPWPWPNASTLAPLGHGSWHTEGWTGAVLSGEVVFALPGDERSEVVRAFLHEATASATEALGS